MSYTSGRMPNGSDNGKQWIETIKTLALIAFMAANFLFLFTFSDNAFAWSHGIYGNWVKLSGDDSLPDRMMVRSVKDTVQMRGISDAGLRTVTYQCDGAERIDVKTNRDLIYSGSCGSNSVIVNYKFVNGPGAYTERWTLEDGGKKLVSTDGSSTTIYVRPTLMERIMRGTP